MQGEGSTLFHTQTSNPSSGSRQVSPPDFWPKGRMGKALRGEAKVGREKYSGTSQLILPKS